MAGEHAVVYGYPALISTIGLKVNCNIEEKKGGKVALSSALIKTATTSTKLFAKSPLKSTRKLARSLISQIKQRLTPKVKYSWQQLEEFYHLALNKFHNYKQTQNKEELDLISKDWYAYTKLAVKEALIELDLPHKLSEEMGLDIKLDSNLPTGGFGSSTAIIVAVARALAAYSGRKLTPENVYRIAHSVEMTLRGVTSGGDEAAIAHDGLIKFRKNLAEPAGKPFVEPVKLSWKAKKMLNCLVINSGTPTYNTGQVVAWLRDQRSKHPSVDKTFERIGELVTQIELALARADLGQLKLAIAEVGELLISLGLVSPDTINLIQKIRKQAGSIVLKISGAGTIGRGAQADNQGSGALLAFGNAEELSAVESWLSKNQVDYYPTLLAQ